MIQLAGQVALVTGASGGIGGAIARSLHGAGARVVLAGRRKEALEALAAGVRNGLNILSGWRFDEFGSDALDLVEGRLAFATENGKLKMSRIDSGTDQAA